MDRYIHVAIKDLLSNPFRRVEHYPIRREKVEALKESIEKTGFWDNLLVRPAGNGKYERAFGEHRAKALKDYYKDPDHKIGVIVRNLSDTSMFQIMVRENMEEWGRTSGIVDIETVHSAIQAYADGRIVFPPVSKMARGIRCAPSFLLAEEIVSSALRRQYNSQTVADFLESGWYPDKVDDALTALQFIQEGLLNYDDFTGLGSTQCRAIVDEARKKYRDRINTAKAAERQAKQAAEEAEKAKAKAAAAKNADEQEEARKALVSAKKKEADAKETAKTYRTRAKEAVTKVGRGVSKKLKAGEIGYREAADAADDIIHDRPKERELMQAEKFIGKLSTNLYYILKPGVNSQNKPFDERTERLDAIIKATKDRSIEIEPRMIQDLVLNLVSLSKRALAYADKLAPTGNAIKFVSGLSDSRMLEDVK